MTIASILISANNIVANIDAKELDVTLIGLGGEALVEPSKFKFLPDNTKSIIDYSYLTIGKKPLDTLATSYKTYFNNEKSLTDTSYYTDVCSLGTSKPLSSSFSSSDYSYLSPNIGVVDIKGFSELYIFNVAKAILDTILATDDVLGSAVLDDDQYVLFEKRVHSTSTYSDTISTTWLANLSFLENYSIYELSSLGLEKPFTDQFNANDYSELLTNKAQLEYLGASELITKVWSIELPLLDQSLALETLYLNTSKPFTDSISKSDILTLGIQDYFGEDFVLPGYTGTSYTA